jgi:hypothetical protein
VTTHAQNSRDVHVFQRRQDPHIAMEIQPGNTHSPNF